MLKVIQIPALQDNYQYLIVCTQTNQAAIVDPAESDSVIKIVEQEKLNLKAIFNTHHHWDHTDGNDGLYQKFGLPVYCSAYDQNRIAHASDFLKEGDQVEVGELKFSVIDIPGHTLGHIAFYGEGAVFCGDTLFGCGCGRLFEGTPEMMLKSLTKLKALSLDTKIYCGHEYTLNNLLFARLLEPQNPDLNQKLQDVRALRKEKKSTVPTLLREEFSYNPFLRVESSQIVQALKEKGYENLDNPIAVFAAIRDWKDQF